MWSTASVGRIVLAAALAAPVALRAQAAPQARTRGWFSSGLAYQSACYTYFSARHCIQGGALRIAGGWALSETMQAGVALTGPVAWNVDNEEIEISPTATALLRAYPLRRAGLFLSGGVGVGFVITPHEPGFVAEAGVGYDLAVGRRVSLTPYLQILRIAHPTRPTTYRQLGLAVTVD